MDHLQKIRSITIALENSGHWAESNNIVALIDAASTGTELLISVTHALIQLVNADNEVADLIRTDVMEIVVYCRSIGLQVK